VKVLVGALLFIITMVLLCAPAQAQVPYVQVYFDPYMTQQSGYCPGVGVVDTLYVGAINFNMWMNTIDFRIEYPPGNTLVWAGDVYDAPLHLGDSPTGVTITWQIPRNAFQPLVVLRPVVLWLCNYCGENSDHYDVLVRVHPHPGKTTIEAVRWPDYAIVQGFGLTSIICPILSSEETTWGKVKALYR